MNENIPRPIPANIVRLQRQLKETAERLAAWAQRCNLSRPKPRRRAYNTKADEAVVLQLLRAHAAIALPTAIAGVVSEGCDLSECDDRWAHFCESGRGFLDAHPELVPQVREILHQEQGGATVTSARAQLWNFNLVLTTDAPSAPTEPTPASLSPKKITVHVARTIFTAESGYVMKERTFRTWLEHEGLVVTGTQGQEKEIDRAALIGKAHEYKAKLEAGQQVRHSAKKVAD
jgi:hypothetical protein